MRRNAYLLILLIAAVLLIGMKYIFFAVPTAVIKIANGIPNVGVGETVTLIANENDSDILSYAWTLETVPDGSAAVFDDAASQTASFAADISGQYQVSLVVTNNDGPSTAVKLWINAGTYLGSGTISSTYNMWNCSLGCHLSTVIDWEETPHATKLEREIDGLGSEHYAAYCLRCHTTGFNATADNGGFDDFMGTAKPDTLNATFVMDDHTPVVDGVADDVWRLAPSLTVAMGETDDITDCTSCHDASFDLIDSGSDVILRALYSSDSIFFQASWSDPTMSITRGSSWSWDGTGSEWVKSSGQSEDRIAFFWPIGTVTGTLTDKGCMVKCHTDGSESSLATGTADMWHGKAARAGVAVSASGSDLVIDSGTNELTAGSFSMTGYMDDKHVDNTGRNADGGTAASSKNVNAAGTAPAFMETNPTDYADAMVLTQAEIDAGEVVGDAATGVSAADAAAYWPNYLALRAVVPENFLDTPTLSGADLSFGAAWKDGVWTVELARKLDTGNDDDIQFDDLTAIYSFGVATMDNGGGGAEHRTSAPRAIAFTEWTFPATLEEGNYQLMIDNYPDLANMANIQCENCHGPGSNHNPGFQTDKNQIANNFADAEDGDLANNCGTCHGQDDQWENSKHSTNYSRAGSCWKCHSGKGFVVENDPDYADFELDTGESGKSTIGCQACHDPHSAENKHQLRVLDPVELGDASDDTYTYTVSTGGLGLLCMNCHKSRRDAEVYVTEYHSHYGPHYGPQADMLFGTNAADFGIPLGQSPHKDVVENTCVTCHMNEYDSHSDTKEDDVRDDFNMPGLSDADTDTLSLKAYSHSFFNSYTQVIGDNTIKYDNMQACQGCHGNDITSFDDIMANEDYDNDGTVEGVQSEVKGMLESLALLLPPIGNEDVTVTSAFTPVQLKVAYNYKFVHDDGSYGVHNASYAIGLLKASFRALATGDIGAGAIISIADVPNDQGKQIQVLWSGFPGDGVGDPKIVKYGVWRKVESSMAKVSGEDVIEVADMDEMFANVNNAEGKLFKVGDVGDTFDFIKEVPAASMDFYSTVAPTLFDSTVVDGQHYTFFAVSGHGSNGSTVMSASDSGYSVDNLAPAAPQALVFAKMTLTWSEPEDEDFNYFSVYRSAVSEFTPGEDNRVATTTTNSFEDVSINIDGTYYYKVSAFDFSGNESEFSSEFAAIVTSVDDDRLVPTEFGLAQNYPNPFNPTTVIEYNLPAAANVKLTVYNMLGQEVRILVSGFESAGFLKVTWDGRDNGGMIVAPGVYLYKLEAGNYVKIKKMVFLK